MERGTATEKLLPEIVKAPEGSGARQYAGHGCHDTQLDEQGDEDEPVGHVISVWCWGRMAEAQSRMGDSDNT